MVALLVRDWSMGVAVEDPYEVLGVRPETPPEEITAAYRELVRLHHPDLHQDEDEQQRTLRHARMAAINAAYRMVNDADELERFRRLQERQRRGQASAKPGHDGVRFTAAAPNAGGAVQPAPGDPDFDYRKRAWREFAVRDEQADPTMWTARPPRRRRGRGKP